MQRAMNRAAFGNIQKPGALLVSELPLELPGQPVSARTGERERSCLGHSDTFLRKAAADPAYGCGRPRGGEAQRDQNAIADLAKASY